MATLAYRMLSASGTPKMPDAFSTADCQQFRSVGRRDTYLWSQVSLQSSSKSSTKTTVHLSMEASLQELEARDLEHHDEKVEIRLEDSIWCLRRLSPLSGFRCATTIRGRFCGYLLILNASS